MDRMKKQVVGLRREAGRYEGNGGARPETHNQLDETQVRFLLSTASSWRDDYCFAFRPHALKIVRVER
jgi:hypothetical protein